ncbi:GNAT family N-acetyltransferase [Enteractinococcus helveticum]|uniref:Acetyltransferase n=1 Tax=Enteractinococcus helveticum TaxID=1837282 RepID=A0A1B7LW18_9MICC|nr:GNAT family N-acetyltransferase [Enteractinococcus helveticum]OAV59200.1 acetyltransferase [Enteractinococcus helveticum]
MTLHLRYPKPDDENVVRALHEQLLAHDGFEFLLAQGSWDEILQTIEHEARGVNLPAGRVPADFFLVEVEGEMVGRVSIRHRLNEYLFNFGGHIGYAVAPEYRGRGYAQLILRRALDHLSTLGVDQALITCQNENLLSARVIEKCGGVLEDVRRDGDTAFRRYWIFTS